jgi:prepilin-type N-terminal cleavage/methylation domain-containing protein
MNKKRGFSLVETLVVVAIILILLSIALPRYAKAIRMAKEVSAGEAHHQRMIDRMVDPEKVELVRDEARRAFRQVADAGRHDIAVTEMLCMVRNDAEFEAYYRTLIDPANDELIAIRDGGLVAKDYAGSEYILKPLFSGEAPPPGNYPIEWGFVSVEMAHMMVGNRGGTVVYRNGQRFVKYPGDFPMTRTVAEFSKRYMDEVWPALD